MKEQPQHLSLDEKQIAELARFVPKTVQKRMALLSGIVEELNRRNFSRLDETNRRDLEKVSSIVWDLHPESTRYKVREYAQVAIRLWNKQRNR